MILIKFKVLSPGGAAPQRMSTGDAGYDLRASDRARLVAGGSAVVGLGVCLDIPSGYYAEITHRSSLAFKKGCICSLGIIDSNYKGEIKAKLFNLSGKFQSVDKGERICQLIIKESVVSRLIEREFSEVEGKAGFGSSGRL